MLVFCTNQGILESTDLAAAHCWSSGTWLCLLQCSDMRMLTECMLVTMLLQEQVEWQSAILPIQRPDLVKLVLLWCQQESSWLMAR